MGQTQKRTLRTVLKGERNKLLLSNRLMGRWPMYQSVWGIGMRGDAAVQHFSILAPIHGVGEMTRAMSMTSLSL